MLRLETAIVYGHTPLSIALHDISQSLPSVLQTIFHQAAYALNTTHSEPVTARTAWQQAWEQQGKRTALTTADFRIVKELGYTLGISDRVDQQKHIQFALKQLEQAEWVAREEQQKYGKMSRSLGVLTGLLVVILMY